MSSGRGRAGLDRLVEHGRSEDDVERRQTGRGGGEVTARRVVGCHSVGLDAVSKMMRGEIKTSG